MMGRSHLMLGAAGWLAIGVPALGATGHELDVAEIAAGTVVASGAAMLPDMDHPQATVSRSLGPVTQVMSRFLAGVFGGHRNGTHSILFAVGVGALLAAALHGTNGPWVALGVCFLTGSLVVRTLTEADGIACAAISAIVAATLVSVAPNMEWIFLSVMIGCLLHDLGDILTPEGVPPLWPINRTRVRFPIIGRTGDWREKIIAGICGMVACVLLAGLVYSPLWEEPSGPQDPSRLSLVKTGKAQAAAAAHHQPRKAQR